MHYKSLVHWSTALVAVIVCLTVVLAVSGVGAGLVAGLSVGIGFGSAFGAITATACHSYDRQKDRQLMEDFIHEHSHSQPQVIYETDPLVIEALGRLTSSAVLNGECCFCLSEHPGLFAQPFSPAFHRENPRCPVPLSRELFEAYQSRESEPRCASNIMNAQPPEFENQITKRLLPQDAQTKTG